MTTPCQPPALGEFELIERFFKARTRPAGPADPAQGGLTLGIGDDCALLRLAPGMELAISSDMLVQDRHFFADVDPAALGHKALAVNLSDLAACGAQPLAFTLSLALPPDRAGNAAWLNAFASGLLALAEQHHCPLAGGDTTAGPLNIGITVLGQVPAGQALRRDGARVGDELWVSGNLGQARAALLALQGQAPLPPTALAQACSRLEWPTPRVALGQALRGIASSAIDLSDGLAGDLRHLLHASGVGACLDAACLRSLLPLPVHDPLALVLTGGDDYELLFTAPADRHDTVLHAARTSATPVTCIGRIEPGPQAWLQEPSGLRQPLRARSFDHFA